MTPPVPAGRDSRPAAGHPPDSNTMSRFMTTVPLRWWRDVEIILPVLLLAVTTVYLAAAFQVSSPFSTELVDASFVPKLVAALMYVALLVVLRDALRRRRAAGAAVDGASDLADPAKVVALTLAYVAAFEPLGYALATVPYVFLLFHVFRFEDRGHLKRLAYAVAITAVFYGLFAGIFNIRLPLWEAMP